MEPLTRLSRRVRWKRWLGQAHRFTWILALTFLAVFLADWMFGMRTLSLRIAALALGGLAVLFFVAAWLAAWLRPLDWLGLAQLLERRYPDLAERLVTLVQSQANGGSAQFLALLRAETEQRLLAVEATDACPLHAERKHWLRTAGVFAAAFGLLAFVPAFGDFTYRLAASWATPLVPIRIEVASGDGYALRGGTYQVRARVELVDPHAEAPAHCELIGESDSAPPIKIAMPATGVNEYAVRLENLRGPLRCQVVAGEAVSAPFEVRLIDAPALSAPPIVEIAPPAYAGDATRTINLDASPAILQYGTLRLRWSLDRRPVSAALRVKSGANDSEDLPVAWNDDAPHGIVEIVAATPGEVTAQLRMQLEHGLSATLPLGRWTVREDRPPRFTQPLFLRGGSALSSQREVRIAPDDVLRLQTEIVDDEGLGDVAIEWRVNDAPALIAPWLNATNKKSLALDDWLPLPKDLREGDRVRFRLHATDNRRLKTGEVRAAPALPPADMSPQAVVAPAGDDAWITLRIDRSLESFVKQQAQTQRDEVRETVEKIKAKLTSESDQLQQLQRGTHQQPVVTPAQVQQAEKLQALNREIVEELARAGQRFSEVPELAALADHFFGIAETEMQKSAAALESFRAKNRPLAGAEKDLHAAQVALAEAKKKLDRMLDWNAMLAQDRLDQFQIDKLAQTQDALVERLARLLDQRELSDAEKAKEIEAIRQEQAKIAERMAKLQEQSKLAQESRAALDQMRLERLAQDAEKLAAEQRGGGKAPANKMDADFQKRLDKFASDLMELSQKGDAKAKAVAKENTMAVDQAKKAMEASQAMKAKGDADAAKKMDADAVAKLDIVAKNLGKLSQDADMKVMPKENAAKIADALKQSAKEMRKAEKNLPTQPMDAQASMKSAAQNLARASAEFRPDSKFPKSARNPALVPKQLFGAAGTPTRLPNDVAAELLSGKAWGELPGEMKTRMLQDYSARFGEEYADMVRSYFERLSQTPARKEQP